MSTNLFDDLHADGDTLNRLHQRLERDAAADVERAPVRDRHQPGLHVGVGGQLGVGPQRGQESLRPCVLGVDGADDRAAHPQHGRAVLGHHVFERSHPHIM